MEKEIWSTINNYPNYEVSNLGRVKSIYRKYWLERNNSFAIKNERIIKPYLDIYGYLTISLCHNGIKRTKKIHKLVAEAFLNHTPCFHELVVNHINFIKTDNRVENIEIVTARENLNKKHIKSSSQYVGVCWHKGNKKWKARIGIKYKRIHLGYFNTEIEAHNAYQTALISLVGNK